MTNKTSFFSGSAVTANQTNAIQSSVDAAEADRLAAAASAAAAAASATTSSTKAGEASTSASTSETSKLASVAAKVAAETAETNSETAETNAAASAAAALVSKNSASASASTSTTKASESSTSAAAALVSKNSATTSAATATTKAAEGVVSAAAALVSKNASVAAQAAAETAETNSETAEAAALVSKNAAAASAAAALISKNSATASAATATTKAGEAATSASSITGAQSASNASAVAAAASQVAAAASAASAATTYDTFDDRYLGAKSGFAGAGTGPSVDNDGNALVEGALFFSSAANEMRVYDGSGFIAASAAGSVSINTFRYTATAGQTTFTGNDEASNALAYTVGNILLSLNGVLLEIPTDVVATSGTSIVLQVAAELNDEINITVFKSFTTADMVSATTGGTHQALVNFSAGINVTGNILASGTVDGVDIAARDAVLSSTVTTSNAALPKSGGAMTGAITTNSTFDGVDIATRDAVLTATTTTANAALPKSGGTLTGDLGIGCTPSGRLSIEGATATSEQSHITFENTSGAKKFAIGGGKSGVTNNGFAVVNVTDNTSPLFIDDSGNLGIGTTSIESWRLAVAGTNFSSGGGLAVAAFRDLTSYNTSNNGAGITFQGIYNSGGGYTNFATIQAGKLNNTDGDYSTYLRFLTRYNGASQVEAMRIDSSGNVGIGTSSPSHRLHINGGSNAEARIRVTNTANGQASLDLSNGEGYFRTYTDAGAYLIYDQTDGADRFVIDTSGNVGIGTSSPATKLQVNFGDAAGNLINLVGDGATAGSAIATNWNTGGSYFDIRLGGTTSAYTKLRVDSAGRSYHNQGTSVLTGHSGVVSSTATTGNQCYTGWNQSTSGNRYLAYWLIGSGGTNVGSIQSLGSSTTYNTSSDYRLKTDVQPMVGASARIQALNPVNFEWIADGTRTDGFLAHEAATVVPEAVSGDKDAMMDQEYEVTPAVIDENGTETTAAVMGTRSVPDMQGIDQSKIVPLLTAALQEALTKIDDMETRLSALEAN